MRKNDRWIGPLARNDGLVVQELSGEVLVYDLKRHHAHCLNPTAAFVWKHCDGHTTVEEIAKALALEGRAPDEVRLVWLALEQLAKSHLLADEPALPARYASNRVSRRKMMRLGAGMALALPLVASLVAPTPAQAATCLSSGDSCSTSASCCSGVCDNGTCL
jgi:coenzyme PQQ synthesis protein D (PqqD)